MPQDLLPKSPIDTAPDVDGFFRELVTQAIKQRGFEPSTASASYLVALLAEAATHGDEQAAVEGWGPGLYLDVEAVEALGRKPKNAPTILRAGGVEFFRAGS